MKMKNGNSRGKMPVSERAKQFMPFAAVSGLDAALEAKLEEYRKAHRVEFGEDLLDKADRPPEDTE